MNRRNYLAVVGSGTLATIAGCSSGKLEKKSDDSDAAEKTREKKNKDSYREIGESFETSTDVKITVDEIHLANSITQMGSGKLEPGNDRMFVLAHVSAKNKDDEPHKLPSTSSFALITGSSQYENYRNATYMSDSQVTAPVSGNFYSGLQEARPQIAKDGWLLFAVPRETEQVTIAWSGHLELSGEEAYWKATIDSSTLPNISVKSIDAPDSVQIGEQFTATITIHNTGGSAGTISTSYSVATPSDAAEEYTLKKEVPAGETITKEITLRPQVLGTASVTLSKPNKNTTISVKPALRKIGESFQFEEGLQLSVRDLVFSDSYSYETYFGNKTTSADSGKQFLFVEFRAKNSTDTAQSIPSGRDISVTVEGTSYDLTDTNANVYDGFVSPVSGDEYPRYVGTLGSGKTKEGWVIYKIPSDAAKEDISVHANWSASYDNATAVYWE
ncbi:DUF4352 domain-containing protein [Haladaptatus cibarius]|nr:DUF4352 domain-containing protein [Haladaptatus cibarius]